MQIVVTLSEEDYNLLVNVNDDKLPSINARRYLHEQLKTGIILPKGHGRLIDADEILKEKRCFEDFDGDICNIIHEETVINANTIIEADKDGDADA